MALRSSSSFCLVSEASSRMLSKIAGRWTVRYSNSAVCMIDLSGNVVLPMVYNYISDCSDGVVTAFSQGHGWTLFNKFSTQTYTEKVNPILKIKKRILADAAFEAAQAEAEKGAAK